MKKRNNILEVDNLCVEFHTGFGDTIHAVSGISFHIARGETLGLIGESGCGKSSVAKAVMQLPRPTSGCVRFCARDLTTMKQAELRKVRPRFQMVFQNSFSALNPRRKVGDSIAMPLKVTGKNSRREITVLAEKMMKSVGVDNNLYNRRPHELSGGQCQRIQIARALMTNPQLLICDEPVSSLDVSIQAQIIHLLETMRKQYDLSMLFISHDLAVVKNISDRIAVMYLGELCETATSEALYQSCVHPYTMALLSAVPMTGRLKVPKKRKRCPGEIPPLTAPQSGCRFRTRCPEAFDLCLRENPVLKERNPGHYVACHLYK